MNVDERPKHEIVSRVLERIAEGRYRGGDEEDGESIVIPDYGPHCWSMRSFLRSNSSKYKNCDMDLRGRMNMRS
jgi:hypothetical protein